MMVERIIRNFKEIDLRFNIKIRVRARIKLLLTVLIACSLQGCQDNDGDSQPTGHESVAVKLALSVAKSTSAGTTRMASTNIIGKAENVDLLCVLPFQVGYEAAELKDITVDDEVQPTPISGNFSRTKTLQEEAVDIGAFFTSSCAFAPGVNKLIAYGRDNWRKYLSENESPIDKANENGILIASFESLSASLEPKDIRFSLQSIKSRTAYESNATAQALATYLTNIAQAKTDNNKTWKADATDSKLKLIYKNFINELAEGVGNPLPGSAANVKKWGELLKSSLPSTFTEGTSEQQDIDAQIKAAIISAINQWNSTWEGFPASIGLPDGAAVVRWQTVTEGNTTVEKFVPETRTTTIADINNIERFTFPAEIYYYGNSATMVSDVDLSGNFRSESTWADVLSGFTKDPVTSTTATVAMKDPLQYGVAQLQVQIQSFTPNLPDANSAAITVGTDRFKLTGIIVGGQLPVGFDFSPLSILPSYSEEDMRFIYDTTFDVNSIYLQEKPTLTDPVNTLVLQSYDRQNVKLVLEFLNKGEKFEGLNGIVYNGTKFYLVGEIVPGSGSPDESLTAAEKADLAKRVFTKDRTTMVTVTVKDLAKAYNVLPNLLSPRLEMGLELTPKWVQATTKDVEL